MSDLFLRFEGLKGECMDDMHPGDKGWVAIKKFSFGCGTEKKADKEKEISEDEYNQLKTSKEKDQYQLSRETGRYRKKNDESTVPSNSNWGKSGDKGLKFDACTFSKNVDRTSVELVTRCHGGFIMPEVEVHAVRYGGVAEGEIKIPFLALVFTNAKFRSIKLELGCEGLPSETISFEYETVKMKTRRTDNETGKKLNDQSKRAGWSLMENSAVG